MRLSVSCDRASQAMSQISELLGAHPGCERIDVMLDDRKLFAVDCSGNALP